MRDRALLLRLSLSASSAAAAAAEALAWHLVPVLVAALTSAIYDTSALQPSLWAAAAALGIFALAARQFLRNLHRNALLAALHCVCTAHEGRAATRRLAEAAHGHVPAAATAALVFASSTAAVFRCSARGGATSLRALSSPIARPRPRRLPRTPPQRPLPPTSRELPRAVRRSRRLRRRRPRSPRASPPPSIGSALMWTARRRH